MKFPNSHPNTISHGSQHCPQQTAIRANISQNFRRGNSSVFGGRANSGTLSPKIHFQPSQGPVDAATLWKPIVFTATVRQITSFSSNLKFIKITRHYICEHRSSQSEHLPALRSGSTRI